VGAGRGGAARARVEERAGTRAGPGLGNLAGLELQWPQPRLLRREFELRADGTVIATLRWASAFKSLAVAEVAGRRWTFKRAGFLRPRVTVRTLGSEADLAIAEMAWAGAARIAFASGTRYRWEQTSVWRSEWAVLAEDGSPRLTFRTGLAMRRRGRLEIDPAAGRLEELPILATLGWYLIVLSAEDAAAAAAGATG